jgi:hypothetical protein
VSSQSCEFTVERPAISNASTTTPGGQIGSEEVVARRGFTRQDVVALDAPAHCRTNPSNRARQHLVHLRRWTCIVALALEDCNRNAAVYGS